MYNLFKIEYYWKNVQKKEYKLLEFVESFLFIQDKSPNTFHKENYVSIVLDDYSRYAQIFLLKQKSETIEFLKSALNYFQSLFPSPDQFKRLRCDNGTDFISESC